MREIQDLTLKASQGGKRVEESLGVSRKSFEGFMARVAASSKESTYRLGMRVSLVPFDPIYLQHVHRIADVKPRTSDFAASFPSNEEPTRLVMGYVNDAWKPLLRGSYTEEEPHGGDGLRLEINDFGEIGYFFARSLFGPRSGIYPGWLISVYANALMAADRFREKAGAPNVEYCLDAEIVVMGQELPLFGYGSIPHAFGALKEGRMNFPQMSIGPKEEFVELAATFEMDLWNAAGYDHKEGIIVDF